EREFTEPVAIRAAGQIEAGLDISGPNGLSSSDFERALGNRARESRRVLPSAPYLALIGRVCSPRSCTEPFLVGSESVLCPSQLDATGALQLWTNNYVRVDGGGRTSLTFT